MEIIRAYGLKPTEYPPPVGFMGRAQAVDFNDTTLETWKREIPSDHYRIREQDKEIIIDESVKIAYGGLDRTETINKFNSAEFAFVFIDQAEEVDLGRIGELRATLRMKIAGQDVPTKILWTANPRQGWLKDEFYQSRNPQKIFIQALPTDNPFLHKNYIEVLKDAFRHRPELLAAYLEGSWDAFEGDDQILFERLIKNAMNLTLHSAPLKRFLVIDPARFGDDETVMYLFENTDIVKQKIYGKLSSDRLINLAHVWALQEKATAIVYDECGIGGPILDVQRSMAAGKYRVIGLNSAAAARDPEKYANLRAEMWMTANRMLDSNQIQIHAHQWMSEEDFRILKSQLCTPTYKFRGSKILVEAKEEIKKRILRSPDRGDCAVMGWYAYAQIPSSMSGPEKTILRKTKKTKSAMAA